MSVGGADAVGTPSTSIGTQHSAEGCLAHLPTNTAGWKYPGVTVLRSSHQPATKGRWWVNAPAFSFFIWDSSETQPLSSPRGPQWDWVAVAYRDHLCTVTCGIGFLPFPCLILRSPTGASERHLPKNPLAFKSHKTVGTVSDSFLGASTLMLEHRQMFGEGSLSLGSTLCDSNGVSQLHSLHDRSLCQPSFNSIPCRATSQLQSYFLQNFISNLKNSLSWLGFRFAFQPGFCVHMMYSNGGSLNVSPVMNLVLALWLVSVVIVISTTWNPQVYQVHGYALYPLAKPLSLSQMPCVCMPFDLEI